MLSSEDKRIDAKVDVLSGHMDDEFRIVNNKLGVVDRKLDRILQHLELPAESSLTVDDGGGRGREGFHLLVD